VYRLKILEQILFKSKLLFIHLTYLCTVCLQIHLHSFGCKNERCKTSQNATKMLSSNVVYKNLLDSNGWHLITGKLMIFSNFP